MNVNLKRNKRSAVLNAKKFIAIAIRFVMYARIAWVIDIIPVFWQSRYQNEGHLMRLLKKYHSYQLKKQFVKVGKYIAEIMPIEDRPVPEEMFEQYEEVKNAIPNN